MTAMRENYFSDPLAINARIVAQYRETGGRLDPPLHGDRIVLLTTVGARTGQARTTPLGFVTDGSPDRLVLFGSNIGAPRTPSWCLNLQATPEVTIEHGAERFAGRATLLASGPERDRLYELFTSQMPGTGEHQSRTRRTIPMVVVERQR